MGQESKVIGKISESEKELVKANIFQALEIAYFQDKKVS
jgi:hypothetical protein